LLLAVFALPVATADARRITFGERDLRQGMRGTDVRVLQDFLTKAGVKTSIDGQYGPKTTSRVRLWERRNSLPVNGRMTREDAATLRGQVETGGAGLQQTTTVAAPTGAATLGPDGKAIAPAGAPPEVVAIIAAANEIVGKPYKYGGGHGDWDDSGYDCSGAESYALNGAGLVSRPLNSTEFMSWGEPGEGQWVTSYAHGGHSFLVVAGLRFDTGYHGGGSGPRWSEKMRPADGFTARHPEGL
jgi:peptidoglycan hydrolase-like protein with peptidoglycan-binding domain